MVPSTVAHIYKGGPGECTCDLQRAFFGETTAKQKEKQGENKKPFFANMALAPQYRLAAFTARWPH